MRFSKARRTGAALSAVAGMAITAVAPPAAHAATVQDWTFDAAQAGLADVAHIVRADAAHAQGFTGKGVGIALIDTGVAPVPGLTSGNVANGPDLSMESQIPALLHRDGYGHGTHMAGIIAGRDAATGFRGIAPDARLTSIKVGMSNGAVDVSQMMAAIDWVVAHRNDDPANPIRVLNLSYGTDSTLRSVTNPLTMAVSNAWAAGIVVVVAAGNTGRNITVPAMDVQVIRVGSTDSQGTTNPLDDTISSFTSNANATSVVVAPGRSIASLRVPGSYADTLHPSARVGERLFKGSGTSQAAAVVSGAAALYLQKYPNAQPWQVRTALHLGATVLPKVSSAVGNLSVNVTGTLGQAPGAPGSTVSSYTGDGSLHAARGSSIVTFGPANTPLTGENDIFGPFSTAAWAKASKARTAWQGGNWMGRPWTGTGWAAASDGQQNWAGRTWSGTNWSGRTWSDIAWAGRTWSGRTWSDISWSGRTWSGTTWSGANWY